MGNSCQTNRVHPAPFSVVVSSTVGPSADPIDPAAPSDPEKQHLSIRELPSPPERESTISPPPPLSSFRARLVRQRELDDATFADRHSGGIAARLLSPLQPPTSPNERMLRVYVISWNLEGKDPPPSPSHFGSLLKRGLLEGDRPPDIVAIGTQECCRPIAQNVLFSSKAHWIHSMDLAMAEAMESSPQHSSYSRIADVTLVGVHLAIYSLAGHPLPHTEGGLQQPTAQGVVVQNILTKKCPTMVAGNKGAVAIRMDIQTTGQHSGATATTTASLLFICGHLRHGQAMHQIRDIHYRKVIRSLGKWDVKRRDGMGAWRALQRRKQKQMKERASRGLSARSVIPESPGQQCTDSVEFVDGIGGTTTAEAGASFRESSPDDEYENGFLPEELEEDSGFMEDFLLARDQLLGSYDGVFFFGDLNYRINGSQRLVRTALKAPNDDSLAALLHNDQLSISRRRGSAFQRFREAPVTFRPTYKFLDSSSDAYYGKRIPSWTDRILCSERRGGKTVEIRQVEYDALFECTFSDHRPVYATYDLVNS